MENETKPDVTNNHFFIRTIISVLVVIVYGTINNFLYAIAPVMSGKIAAAQLNGGDTAYVASKLGMDLFKGDGISFLLLLFVMLIIWFKPIMNIKKIMFPAVVTALATILISTMIPTSSYAYYDTLDRDEYIEIGPNQTAFLIPLEGDTKNNQAQFLSVEYLKKHVVAVKRIKIPHTKLHMATLERDYWIPSEKLIIVDRSFYSREWVKSSARGTSTHDDALYFETADSIDGWTGLISEAKIPEEDAAKFLYTFGVKKDPMVEKGDPKAVYASVVYGYSLADIMDTIVKKKAGAVLTEEFGKRSTIDCIKQKSDIIKAVNDKTIAAYKDTGIIINYIGFAEGITFSDPKIQEAINKVFIANTEASALDARAKILQVSMLEASVKVKEAQATAITKWDGKIPALPSWLMLPNGAFDSVIKAFSGDTTQTAKK